MEPVRIVIYDRFPKGHHLMRSPKHLGLRWARRELCASIDSQGGRSTCVRAMIPLAVGSAGHRCADAHAGRLSGQTTKIEQKVGQLLATGGHVWQPSLQLPPRSTGRSSPGETTPPTRSRPTVPSPQPATGRSTRKSDLRADVLYPRSDGAIHTLGIAQNR
jgi:hypothetical protein